MKCIVLVAGLGSRLGLFTLKKPKCLIEIGGKSILERLLEQINKISEITEVILVTGYRHNNINEIVNKWNSEDDKLLVSTIFNDRYSETNNAYSLWCAKSQLNSSFVLIDGDLIIDDKILTMIIESNGIKESCIAVDFKSILDEEAMKISISKEGRVLRLSKKMNSKDAKGESIGLCKISENDAPIILNFLNRLIDNGKINTFYESAFQLALENEWKPVAVNIENLSWIEIDDENDLRKARTMFDKREISLN